MTTFAVVREAGAGWADGKSAFEQPGVEDHTAFMNGLAVEGVVLFGGPLAESETGRIRALLIIEAPNEAALRGHLSRDPWSLAKRLETVSVDTWKIFVGKLP